MAEHAPNLSGLAIGELTEADCRAVLASARLMVCEWRTAGLVFLRSDEKLSIIQCGSMGGGTTAVNWGMKYLNIAHLEIEWAEICNVARAYA